MDLQLLNPSFHFSVAHEPNGWQTTKKKHGKIKGNVWSLSSFFVSSRTSGQKPKLTITCICNNKNATQLQCTSVLVDHYACTAIGINTKHASISWVTSLAFNTWMVIWSFIHMCYLKERDKAKDKNYGNNPITYRSSISVLKSISLWSSHCAIKATYICMQTEG